MHPQKSINKQNKICLHNVECTTDEFTCKSGKCIPVLTVCDDVKDCPDGDDEQNCDCARNEVSRISSHFSHQKHCTHLHPSTKNNFFCTIMSHIFTT